MKKFWIAAGIIGMTMGAAGAYAQDSTVTDRPGMQMGKMMGSGMTPTADERESAGIPAPMKTRHLARMRNHLEAVHDIVDAMARGEFGEASKTARQELAMRPGMAGKGMGQGKGMGMGQGKGMGGGMCKGMTNEEFKSLGMGFHKSAGKLADVLEQGDMKASLTALSNTMNYCISCHASFRQ